MSELRTFGSERIYLAVDQVEREAGDIDTLHLDDTLFYLKSEADKKIKDIVQGAISMFRESSCCRGLDLKSPLGQIADAAFKHWNRVEYVLSNNRQLRLDKACLLRLNKQLRDELKSQSVARQIDKLGYNLSIRHQKYKRCLAMADMCKARYDEEDAKTNGRGASWDYISKEMKYWERWRWRWDALTEKFKETK